MGHQLPRSPYAIREVPVWTFRAAAVTVAGLALLSVTRLRDLPLAVPRPSTAVGLLMAQGIEAYVRAPLGFAHGLPAGLGRAGRSAR